MIRVLLGLTLFLAACGTTPKLGLTTRAVPAFDSLPAMRSFTDFNRSPMRQRSNEDLARDFLELTFEMESGKLIDRLTRFDQPITVGLAQEVPPQFETDLQQLLARLRQEAGIRITQSETGKPANINVVTLPRRQLQATVPHAACFVVPRVRDWAEFRKNRRSGQLDWTTLEKRDLVTVFIPDDVAPQEARDCLHEEIAQALGPLNDIYRLDDSVYNDDNINTVLSNYDMLILRIHYDPVLKNGMRRDQVAEALPAILKRLNPAGETTKSVDPGATPRAWIDAIEAALGPRQGRARRLTHARRALAIATAAGWNDNRLGFTLFAQGRLALGLDGATSADSFQSAYILYTELYGTDDIHTAHVALQLAAFSLSSGDTTSSLKFINDSLPAAARAQNASLLATFLMLKAEALDMEGRKSEAATVRLDSLGWARYGFASDDEIRARLHEIAALRPRKKKADA